ncbi:hypothetical protein [Rhizobium subbaraonis]|uniref:hypothetical protein n=1 Tax=Rhizobium subbaraonis TaxID=908946 RepID=UPI0011433C83|nr:hypothetical protein [Rhizobium subbaraonis]
MDRVVIGISLILSSCAGVDVRRVTSENQAGIRYWRPAPYLAFVEVKDDKSVRCELNKFELPDKTEEYAITMRAGMGTVKATPTLVDGWQLTGFDVQIDSKTPENLTAIATLLKSIPQPAAPAGADTRPARSAASSCQGVYKVNYDNAGNFSGFQRVL